MPDPLPIYGTSLALLTDLYQLTMAYGYWKLGRADQRAVFHLTFRKHPFAGGYSVACGLHAAIDYLRALRFDASDVDYLGTLTGNDGKPLFERGFLDYLLKLEFALDVDAVPEGTAVFPHEPLVRVTGPILQAQIIETPLLNLVNFQTLIATKAARVCQSTRGEPVLEFGLRRAQGIDGGLSASRAAYVGGCDATSNVLAGKVHGIPVRGTHAHSWVMSFDDELEAFDGYADAMPNNCVFLVDTYDTLEGVRRAVQVGKRLRAKGHEMVGIRLDSGDLAYLSIEARKILDAGGFPGARILASNDLDEHLIASLKEQGAKIGVWGVGTKLVTAYDQPALGGVYKLSAIREGGDGAGDGAGGRWHHKVKLSEQAAKTSNPGVMNVRRFRAAGPAGEFVGDAIYDETLGPAEDDGLADAAGVTGPAPTGPATTIVDPFDPTRRKRFDPAATAYEDLLVPVFRGGRLVYTPPALADVRRRAQDQLARLHPGVRRFLNPHQYPVGLERRLHELKTKLILDARGHA